MKRKLLSVFLALCMTLTLVPTAFAGDTDGSTGEGTADNPFTTVAAYNAAVADEENSWDGKDIYLTISNQQFTSENTFALTNVQKRANPPKLHLTLTDCTFTGNTANDTTNSSFMYLSNCQELVMKGCTFNAGESGLKYGINWNLIQIKDATVDIQDCTFTGSYEKNALKLNQRNGEDDTATDVNVGEGEFAASIASASIINCTFPNAESNVDIQLGSAGKGNDGAAAPSTGAFPVTIQAAEGSGVTVELGYLMGKSDESKTVAIAAGQTASKTAKGDFALDENLVAQIGNEKYASLSSAVENAKENDTITLLQDVALSEKLTINKAIALEGNNNTITGKSDSTEVYFEITSGTFTISNAKLTGFGDTAATQTGYGVFKIPSSASSAKIVAKNLTVEKFNRAAFDVRSGSFEIADCNINCDNGATDRLTKGIVAWEGAVSGTVTGGTITGANSTYEGWSANGIEVSAGSTVTVKGVTIDSMKGGISVARNAGSGKATVTVEDCTINAADYALRIFESNNSSDAVKGSSATLTVNGGKYTGDVRISIGDEKTADGSSTITINSGYFTADPSAYVAEGKAAVESDLSGYNFMIGEANTEAPAEVVAGAPEIAEVPADITGKDKTLADGVKTALTGGESGSAPALLEDDGPITAAASTVANSNTITEDAGRTALTNAGVTVSDETSVSIVIQPYMDIAITGADSTNGTFTLEITPMYRTIATTADPSKNEIILKAESGKTQNAVQMGEAEKLTVSKPVIITLPLPTGFAADGESGTLNKLFVKHVKENGKTYFYTGAVAENVLTFINPHGFSSFTVAKNNEAKAEINGIGYASLQAAIADVNSGGTIKLLANDSAVVSDEISFTVVPGNFKATITAGSGYEMTQSGNTYTFTQKTGGGGSSGGGGGGGGGAAVTTYTLTFDTNGGTAIAKVTKDKGTTINLSDYTTTREGYTFAGWYADEGLTDKVTSITLNANKTVYAKWTENVPVEPEPTIPFTDVSEGDWFYDAVCYVYENGMMNGVSETSFAPNATTSRAMIVTILYRLENEPAVSGSSFTDVPSGQWYSNAVAWAAENGIVNGVTDTTFAPNSAITREQMAAILYRYAAWKGCDVSGRVDLSGYTDAASVSAYATEAMAWANAEGLITGVTDTTLRPAGSAVRAQAATILMRLCENVLA